MFNFNFGKKKSQGETLTLKIQGMHCTSCSLNIDSELEDVEGVMTAATSFASSQTKVTFDPKQVDQEMIIKTIGELGYVATVI